MPPSAHTLEIRRPHALKRPDLRSGAARDGRHPPYHQLPRRLTTRHVALFMTAPRPRLGGRHKALERRLGTPRHLRCIVYIHDDACGARAFHCARCTAAGWRSSRTTPTVEPDDPFVAGWISPSIFQLAFTMNRTSLASANATPPEATMRLRAPVARDEPKWCSHSGASSRAMF